MNGLIGKKYLGPQTLDELGIFREAKIKQETLTQNK